ncbi:Uncharacterised protein [Ectopseudomonas mendocina]|jgi:hypothetical protein|uniref:Uncharacterized protein n=1 Tax=Ectopseudomonas mendocina TaxID=300 RepID=A0A379IZ67_ECTME|nr:Uncharacterised protein [Pseudomonas mendocina]SUD41577.1 Uncharacterised protein [Pseudomonas mendocina]VEE14390.1 Uncharacterised protein [Pseudomonas mendocina]
MIAATVIAGLWLVIDSRPWTKLTGACAKRVGSGYE